MGAEREAFTKDKIIITVNAFICFHYAVAQE